MSVLDQPKGLPPSELSTPPPSTLPTHLSAQQAMPIYQTLVASMHEAVVVYGNDGRVMVANSSARELLGLGHGTGWVHPDWQMLTDNGSPLPATHFPAQITLTTGKHLCDVVIGLARPHDEPRWVAIGTQPLLLGDTCQGVVMTVRDITHQRRLESSLRQETTDLQASLARLHQVMHLSHLGIATWDIVTDVSEWWGEMHTIFGVSEQDFTGHGSDYLAMVHPDDLTTIGEIVGNAFDTAVTEAELLTRRFLSNPAHFRLIRADGSVRYVEGSAIAVVDAEGLPVRLFGFLQDVTERRSLEVELETYRHSLEMLVNQRTAELGATNARLHREITERVQAEGALYTEKEQNETILRHVANPVILTDPLGTILYVNPAFEQVYGYSAAEVIGQNPRLLQSGGTAPETYVQMWQTITAGQTWSGLVFNRTKAGTAVDANLTIVPVRSASGVVQHFVAVHHDVTEARRFAAMKEAFIANAAHDLANPVAALGMTLDLLKAAPDLLDDRLPALERQVNRLDSLVNDLLMVSRLDRKLLPPRREPLDWRALVAMVVESQQVIAHHKGIDLVTGPCEPALVIEGDIYQLERVVVNLVANALNYTPDGGQVRVSTERHNHHATLTVQDTGIGIAATELPRIFERFYRTDAARQHSYGTGLGLAIVKEILDLHGGEIAVESREGHGTTVVVRLAAVGE